MNERVALVTGGVHGIGRAVVRRLAADGWRVAVVDCDAATVEGAALSMTGDVADPLVVAQLAERIGQEFCRLDLLVNNAGISQFRPLEQADLEHWNRVLAVNLTAPFLLSQALAPLLRAARGSIVNIASTRALMSEKGTEAYSASKGGLVALTHALAVSLGPDVRVNCISPGWIDVAGDPLRPEDHAQHPAGRVGRPDDVAALVAWLASPEAGFMTGANLPLDGGMTRKMIYAE
jgi:NAD(P)-dependent dehydrogenase (short-subunit alcohol dehydrogenase family)